MVSLYKSSFSANRIHSYERGPMHFAKESTILLTPDPFSLGPYAEHCFSVNRTHAYGRIHRYFAKDMCFEENYDVVIS